MRRKTTRKVCERCGKRFSAQRSDGRFCGDACRQQAHRIKHGTAAGERFRNRRPRRGAADVGEVTTKT